MDASKKLELDLFYIAGCSEIEEDDEGLFAWFSKDTPEEILFYARDVLKEYGLYDVTHELIDGSYVVYGYFEGDEDESTVGYDRPSLGEAKVVIKVNAKGKRRRKKVCGKGKRFNGTKCVMIKASSKRNMKVGLRKRKRTNKAKGGATKRRTKILRNKAMKKRRSQGLS